MKQERQSPRTSVPRRKPGGAGIPHLPMEWMDPMSWRLPSGMALAEFALQTGFLAPLMMRTPKAKRRVQTPEPAGSGMGTAANPHPAPERLEEAPARMASFRQTR